MLFLFKKSLDLLRSTDYGLDTKVQIWHNLSRIYIEVNFRSNFRYVSGEIAKIYILAFRFWLYLHHKKMANGIYSLISGLFCYHTQGKVSSLNMWCRPNVHRINPRNGINHMHIFSDPMKCPHCDSLCAHC